MKVLGLVLGLLTTANVMGAGFSSTIRIEPYSSVVSGEESSNFTDLEFYLKYTNSFAHTFEVRPEFRNKNSETNARDLRVRHTFTLGEVGNAKFGSDFRLLFQGESQNGKSFGELNAFRFGPSVTFSTDIESTGFFFLVKPIMRKYFNSEKFVLNDDGTALTPSIDYDIMTYFAGGMSLGKVSVEVGYGYQMKWNSTGDQVDDGYELYQELVFAANSNLSFVLGHVTYGDLYDDDGRSNTISLATGDGNGNLYYGKLVLNF